MDNWRSWGRAGENLECGEVRLGSVGGDRRTVVLVREVGRERVVGETIQQCYMKTLFAALLQCTLIPAKSLSGAGTRRGKPPRGRAQE
jgi:hypothetical protein